MSTSISTYGLQSITTNNLTSGQKLLSQLSQQLTTGKYSTNLTDYKSSDAQKLLNLTSKIGQQNGFLDIISSLTSRVKAYDKAMTGVEDSMSTAYSALLSSTTYDPDKNASIQSSIEGYVQDMVYYLNQKFGDRYIFAGTRYDTAPVVDQATILGAAFIPPAGTTTVASPAVPNYDVDYPTAAVPEAWVKDSATIDTAKSLTYGVTSTDQGFQQLILGLQWAYAATQDPTNYTAYMDNALNLISDGMANVRATHTSVTNSYNTLEKTSEMVKANVTSLDSQIDDIEAVDVNEVGVKITSLKAQLEAAYAVTAEIINLSLLKYL